MSACVRLTDDRAERHCCAADTGCEEMTAVPSMKDARSGRAVVVALFLLLLHMFASQAYAQGEPRWALVIGNNAYRNVPKLRAAVNDAASMAATLRQLRFEVLERPNLDRAGMYRA